MISDRKGYLQRVIEQLRKLFAALLKLREAGDVEGAQAMIRDASLSLLGIDYGLLTGFDAETCTRMLGDPERIKVLVRLMTAEADLLATSGDRAQAQARLRHGQQLLGHLGAAHRDAALELGASIDQLLARIAASPSGEAR